MQNLWGSSAPYRLRSVSTSQNQGVGGEGGLGDALQGSLPLLKKVRDGPAPRSQLPPGGELCLALLEEEEEGVSCSWGCIPNLHKKEKSANLAAGTKAAIKSNGQCSLSTTCQVLDLLYKCHIAESSNHPLG